VLGDRADKVIWERNVLRVEISDRKEEQEKKNKKRKEKGRNGN
jgi:hypothetical protein